MKKIKLLVAPLLVVPFLASCNGGTPTPSVDKHAVTEQEFNDACSFKDVQYLQVELTSTSGGVTYTSPAELSPTVSHMISESSYPSYYEIFVQKKSDGSYERATRDDKSKDEYSFEPASESDFLTTQSISVNVFKQLQHVGLSYSSFTYDSKAGTYSATFTPEGSETPVTTTLMFENKILISDVTVGEDDETQTTYTYEEKTPEYPEKPPVDPTKVTKEEFLDALDFSDVEYLQITEIDEIVTDYSYFSPTINYEKYDDPRYDAAYYDIYYKKDGDTYKQARCGRDLVFVETDITEEDFLTPAEGFEQECLSGVDLPDFEDFTYDEDEKLYSCSTDVSMEYQGVTYEFTVHHKIKFLDKKIVEFYLDQEMNGEIQVLSNNTLGYEEIIPTYPYIPEYTVTEDEFKAAFAFTGIQYAQMKVYMAPPLEQDLVVEYSPEIMHQISISTTFGEENYVEMYIKHQNDVATEGVERESEKGEFSSIDGDFLKNIPINPADYVSVMFDATTVDFSKVQFSDYKKTYSYTDEYENKYTFRFEDKKLVSLKGESEGELFLNGTCTYKEITPVYPVLA